MSKSMKPMASFVSVISLLIMLVACGDTESSSNNEEGSSGNNTDLVETENLRVAFNQPESHPQFKAMESFGEKFNERTNGAFEVEVSPNELLGEQSETIELVQSGTIDMAIVAGPLMENFQEDFVVFNLPYVFDSKEHQMAVVNDEEIVSDLYHSVEDQGMIVAGAFHGGVRNVYNSEKSIESPEDLNGMKIRVIDSDTNIEMMSKMGGVGTPMGQGEVYTAIQSGVLDGGENNELIFNDLSHVEIAPYYTFTQHLMIPDYLIINADVFNEMSEEEKSVFNEELQAAIDLEVTEFDAEVEAAVADAEEAGAIFNEVDISVFQQKVAPLIEEKITSDSTQELYDRVRSAAE